MLVPTYVVGLLAGLAGSIGPAAEPGEPGEPEQPAWPLVIAHRGSSGERPEHTLEAYALAIAQGADFIEPDLVPTWDGVLIARHENALASVALDPDGRILRRDGRPVIVEATTDVAEHAAFADRLTVKRIDGEPVGGWFAEDFTFAEIGRLRCRERMPDVRPASAAFDDRFRIPSLADVVRLVEVAERVTGRAVGIIPETKHPTYFAHEGRRLDGEPIGMSLGRLLVRTLRDEGFTDPQRVLIQSFEVANLLELHETIMPEAGVDLPLVQLLGDLAPGGAGGFAAPYDVRFHAGRGDDLRAIYGGLGDVVEGGLTVRTGYHELASEAALRWMASRHVRAIGPWKQALLPRERARLTGHVHPVLGRAIAAGLWVIPYTVRAEERFLARHASGVPQSAEGEVMQLLSLGVHGVFIDQPAVGVDGRDHWLRANGQRPVGGVPPARALEDTARILAAFAAEPGRDARPSP